MTTAQQTIAQTTTDQTQPTPDARVLAIDIGGTGLKAAILNLEGDMLTERLRIDTPHPSKPDDLVNALVKLVEPLAGFDYVSVGFPGVVRNGKIITAPNLGTEELGGFDLAATLQERLGKPVRVINDADMQGFGAIETLRALTHFDKLYIGGGNSAKINFELDPDVKIISNECGVRGGAWLWRER